MDGVQCFNAEVDPTEINLPSSAQMNIGERVLRSLFRNWIKTKADFLKENIVHFDDENNEKNEKIDEEKIEEKNENDKKDEKNEENKQNNENNNLNNNNEDKKNENNNLNDKTKENNNNNKNSSKVINKKKNSLIELYEKMGDENDEKNNTFKIPAETPVIISHYQTGLTITRSNIGDINHSLSLPPWVFDCIVKVSFYFFT